jgi:hypothetical protein
MAIGNNLIRLERMLCYSVWSQKISILAIFSGSPWESVRGNFGHPQRRAACRQVAEISAQVEFQLEIMGLHVLA